MTHILGLRLHGTALVLPVGPRRAALSSLTRVQSISAGVLAAFGVVHLSAPLMGLLHVRGDMSDRVDAVSRWMLLGRVAYQSGVGEVALWTAFGVHLAAGAVKRLLSRFTVARSAVEGEEVDTQVVATRRQGKLTWTQKSGWLLAPFAIHHAFFNRILPSSRTPPISSLSPSELDYSFVAHTLSHPNVPVRAVMATAYTLLIGAFAVHVTYAVPALLRSLPRKSSSAESDRKVTSRKRSKGRVSASLAVVLLASLVSIVPLKSDDRLHISGTLKTRYDAVLASAWPTRFLTR
ncbi:uncharacterized protein SRS1_11929 [Sporisorium reilianum f. sp. reilianum]|uniref:Mitochondrial adapter protein MCP1 transmembrane domain-containing protein n=1 Tax=Sporisorium reilianum f. sp. reilianum TaxID=72559 RepID=A0A2N8U7G2_9BASI|nr:uncharacterized protein SRS1_11929 [Sporisorium reilianum f. sp. reilianum]